MLERQLQENKKREYKERHTLSSSIKLDINLAVHVLCQIQDIFLFGLFLLLLLLLLVSTATATACATSVLLAAATVTASAAPTATAAERGSLGHFFCNKKNIYYVEEGIGGMCWRDM
jgi:hypothetical protein